MLYVNLFSTLTLIRKLVLFTCLIFDQLNGGRRQKQEKVASEIKTKKLGAVINTHIKKCADLLETENRLVCLNVIFSHFSLCDFYIRSIHHQKLLYFNSCIFFQGIQVQGCYKEIEDLKKQEESRQQRVLKAKEDLTAAEIELQNMPHSEAPKNELVSYISNFVVILCLQLLCYDVNLVGHLKLASNNQNM